MLIQKFEDQAEWLTARMGKITGTRLKDLVVKRGTGKKIGFYELIAERIGLPADGENPMDRGHRLEDEAVERYEEMTGKKVDKAMVIWSREDNQDIAVSPDGMIEGTDETEALEIKCLSSARHIEAYLTKQIPDEYHYQKLQYFIVNDKLQKLTFAFYDPRLKVADFFLIEVNRADVLKEIEELMIIEHETLKEIDSIVNSLLTF
jgi:predicted phage-related endonuclease